MKEELDTVVEHTLEFSRLSVHQSTVFSKKMSLPAASNAGSKLLLADTGAQLGQLCSVACQRVGVLRESIMCAVRGREKCRGQELDSQT